jgi:hypothetical protein
LYPSTAHENTPHKEREKSVSKEDEGQMAKREGREREMVKRETKRRASETRGGGEREKSGKKNCE